MWITLEAKDGGDVRRVEVAGPKFVVGRDPDVELTLEDDPKVSRRHAELRELPDGTVELRDLDSSNGTFVDEKRVTGPVILRGGERVRFGRTTTQVAKTFDPNETVLDPTEPKPTKTVIGESPAVPPPSPTPPKPPAPDPFKSPSPSPSVVERIKLQRGLRTATIVAGAAVLVALAAIVLVVTGVFSGSGGSDELSTEEVVDKVRPSTVYVEATTPGSETGSTGSGWVLDADEKLIVTNAHVVGGESEFKVNLEDRGPKSAELVANSPCEDLAVLRVSDLTGAKAIKLRSQDDLKQGESVLAVGFPGSASTGQNLVTTEGVVSVVKTTVGSLVNAVRTDAAINGGNSGGPLVDRQGRLVGVNDQSANETQNENYAIGADRVKEITDKLRKGDSIGWSGLGIEYDMVLEGFDGIPTGVLVTKLAPGSPASRARVPVPSLLTTIDGETVGQGGEGFCKTLGTKDRTGTAEMTFIPMSNVETDDQGEVVRFSASPPQQLTVGFE